MFGAIFEFSPDNPVKATKATKSMPEYGYVGWIPKNEIMDPYDFLSAAIWIYENQKKGWTLVALTLSFQQLRYVKTLIYRSGH